MCEDLYLLIGLVDSRRRYYFEVQRSPVKTKNLSAIKAFGIFLFQ